MARPKQKSAAEEKALAWLATAKEIQAVDARGDATSASYIKQLMLDAIPVVEALVNYEPPVEPPPE